MRLRLTAAVLVLAAAALAASACGGGEDEPLSGRLIVTRANEGLGEFSLATSEERVLIPAPPESVLIEPAVSQDGARIAYVRQLTPIVQPGVAVEFGMDLYIANADGSDARPLLEHMEQNEQIRSPAWFPDGRTLLINVQRLSGAQVTSNIERFDVETGDRAVVVENAIRPAVSPDGALIAYVTLDEMLAETLWVANPDGSEPRALTGPSLGGFTSAHSPEFSPDGASIAFGAAQQPLSRAPAMASRAGMRVAALNGLPADIWRVDVASGETRKLATTLLDQPSVTWSADGAKVYVFSAGGLFVLDADGGEPRALGPGTYHGQVEWLAE